MCMCNRCKTYPVFRHVTVSIFNTLKVMIPVLVPILIVPSARLGSDECQFGKSLVWLNQELNFWPSTHKACALPIQPLHSVTGTEVVLNYGSGVVCTTHRHLGVDRVLTSGLVSTLAWNAKDRGSIPALGTIFPVVITPTLTLVPMTTILYNLKVKILLSVCIVYT